MKNLLSLAIIAMFLLSIGCTKPAEQPVEEENEVELTFEQETEQTQNVINHHLKAFQENNLEAIMEDYTDESVMITPDSIFVGLDAIKGFIAGILPAFPTEGTTMTMDRMVVHGELGYIMWHATTPTLNVSLASDTYIVDEGKIEQQTFVGVMTPVEASAAATPAEK